jgi:hypothetical protein
MTTRKREKPGEFDYINEQYGLCLKKNCAVVQKGGKRGQVSSAYGAHIYIRWDGEAKEKGPYHPTWELSYPAALTESQ